MEMRCSRFVFVLAASVLLPAVVEAQGQAKLEITIDWTLPDRVLRLFDKGQASTAELDSIMQLPVVAATIEKHSYSDRATVEVYRESLVAGIAGRAGPAGDPFRFPALRRRIDRLRPLVEMARRNMKLISDTVAARLQPWVPSGVNLSTTVLVAMGGGSSGWVDGQGTQYVGINPASFGGVGDFEAIVRTVVHEVYHAAQRQFMPPSQEEDPDPRVANRAMLLENVIREGTASLLSDPTVSDTAGTADGDFHQWELGYYYRNLNRLASNFDLFDALLIRAAADSGASSDDFYTIGFTSVWSSPLYFIGYRMAQQIIKYDGLPALVELMKKPASRTFLRYIELYRTHPEDKEFVRFATATERILGGL
jgi:hypothetical protein